MIEELSEEELKNSIILTDEFVHEAMCNVFKDGIFDVKFTKADGTIREMRCTRDANHIPQDDNELTKPIVLKEGQKPRAMNYSVLRAYEIGVGWRSFKIENLIGIPLKVNDYENS
jgi:hypothetical protein